MSWNKELPILIEAYATIIVIAIAEIVSQRSVGYFKAIYNPATNVIIGVANPKNKKDIPIIAGVKTNKEVSELKINSKGVEELLYINAIAKEITDKTVIKITGTFRFFMKISAFKTLKAFQSFHLNLI